jgi:hypothetical protein
MFLISFDEPNKLHLKKRQHILFLISNKHKYKFVRLSYL